MPAATVTGRSRRASTRLQTRKIASATTAPNTSALPSAGCGPRAGVAAPRDVTMRMPSTASPIAADRRPVQRSPRTTAASAAATAGVVLVTIPPSAALVRARPARSRTLNANIPLAAWSAITPKSRAPIAGTPRAANSASGTRISEALAKRMPLIRKTGRWATRSFPTTTELPTSAMATASSRQARTRVVRPSGGALDLIRELAERADGPSGDLAAARAFLERHGFDALEGGARPIEEAEEEVVLGAGGRLLHPAQDLFVGDRRGARRERAFLDDVVDAAKERIGRRLALRQPIERLHATHQLGMRRRQRRRLPRERVGLPVHDRPEQRRRFVVEIVTGGHHGKPALEGDAIHQVALAEPASRTRRSSRHGLDDRHGRADLFGDGGDDQRHAMGGREFLAAGLRLDGIVEDAEVEVEAGRPVALLDQHLPQRQRVLASRHRHQHGLLGREHPVLADRLADLIAEELDEVRLAEGGVVPPELDDRPSAALPAFQEASPIISPLASPRGAPRLALPPPIISPLASPRRVSARTATTHHRAQLDRVVVGDHLVGGDEGVAANHQHGFGNDLELAQDVLHPPPAGDLDLALRVSQDDFHWSEWRALGSIRGWPGLGTRGPITWESRMALDITELAEMDAMVLRLEERPLGEVEIGETEVLEDQPLGVEGRQLL